MIWRPWAKASLASRTIFLSAVALPARSTAIMPTLRMNQPNSGIISSSRFRMKAGLAQPARQEQRLPRRLVLGGDDRGAFRQMLEADLAMTEPAEQPQQEQRAVDPQM